MEEKATSGRFSPTTASPPPADEEEELMRRQLIAKEQELQKMRLELELAETKAKLQLQRKQVFWEHCKSKNNQGNYAPKIKIINKSKF